MTSKLSRDPAAVERRLLRQTIYDHKHSENQAAWLRNYAEWLEKALDEERPGRALRHLESIEDLLPRLRAKVEALKARVTANG